MIVLLFSVSGEEIKKKLKSLRSQYLREKNKLKAGIKSGMGVNELPKPNWQFFDQMHFLVEVVGQKAGSRSNLGSNQTTQVSLFPVNSNSKHFLLPGDSTCFRIEVGTQNISNSFADI